MTPQVIVFWIGNIGIPNKGPGWMEPYNPARTIGELVRDMTANNVGGGKRVEIFKHEYGNLNKYDKSNPYWNHSTTLAEYVSYCGGLNGNYVQLIFCAI
jgi:hypothetical protein